MDEIQILQKRLEELAKQSYQSGIFTFSDFLSLAEQDVFYRMERELSYSKPSLFGGAEPCERKIVRFGSEDELGYSLDYPIKCIKASAKDPKFSDGFSHRDLLGALMNLGIKRQMLGDIAVDGTDGFIFCHGAITAANGDGCAEMITQGLQNIHKGRRNEDRVGAVIAGKFSHAEIAAEFFLPVFAFGINFHIHSFTLLPVFW